MPAVRDALDRLDGQARHLVEVANATVGGSLDQLDHHEIDVIDRVAGALDTWSTWARGRPVALTSLAAAVEALAEIAEKNSPAWASADCTDLTQLSFFRRSSRPSGRLAECNRDPS